LKYYLVEGEVVQKKAEEGGQMVEVEAAVMEEEEVHQEAVEEVDHLEEVEEIGNVKNGVKKSGIDWGAVV